MSPALEAPTNGKPPKRTTGGASLGQDSSRDARRLAAAILEVLAGQRTPTQAAQALTISLPRYYQVEAGALRGLLAACEPKPRGRQLNLDSQVRDLKRANERLQRDVARQQALVRLTQRAAGLPAATPTPAKAGKQGRRRRPVVRALAVAERLRAEPESAAPGTAS
jgi:uncharacterized protein (DUF2267 family)